MHIRALIKADTVLLFDSYGSVDSKLHSIFLYHLEASLSTLKVGYALTFMVQHNLKVKGHTLPYEFRSVSRLVRST